MIIDETNGRKLDSRSITASGGVVTEDIFAGPSIITMHRLGGVLGISVGTATNLDRATEVQQGTVTYAAGNLLTGSNVTDPFGRQVLAIVGDTTANVEANSNVAAGIAFRTFTGIYNGRGGSLKGFNMPAATGPTIAIASVVPKNTLTYQNNTATVVSGDAAMPGDVIQLVRYGHVVGWASDVGAATAAGQGLSNISTAAPTTGSLSLSSPCAAATAPLLGQAVGWLAVALDGPITEATSGAGMGVRMWVGR